MTLLSILDDKPYGAYLSYHFSSDLDKFAQEDLHQVVTEVRVKIEELGFKTYDETRDGIYTAGNCQLLTLLCTHS